VVGEGVTPKGEQCIVAPPGVVRGGEVQRERDKRTNVLHASSLDVDVGDDYSLVVVVRQDSTASEGRGRHR
jgi:hypothetical protein